MLATLASAQSNDLVSAAGRGDLPTVNALLQAGADVNATQELVSFGRNSEDGATALGLAAQNGHLTVVQALLAAKADVDAGSIPALYHATAAGNLDIVKALLAAKPNLDWRDPGLGSTTLMFALAPNDSVLRNQLPREGRWDIARLLVEAGANVNVTDKGGVTALMLAVQEDGPRGLAMVQVLLAAHADVNGGCVCRTMRRRSGA
jgi:ankyrin repeat protein